jgi:hypothetical protein
MVTTFNPSTATSDAGAETLVSLRAHRAAHAGAGETVGLFGQYAIHQNNGHILANQDIEVLEYKRQNDKKHQLVDTNVFLPHGLKSNYFQSFRVLSNSCDDTMNVRPMHRLELEVDYDGYYMWTLASFSPTLRCRWILLRPEYQQAFMSRFAFVRLLFGFAFRL